MAIYMLILWNYLLVFLLLYTYIKSLNSSRILFILQYVYVVLLIRPYVLQCIEYSLDTIFGF